MQAYELLAHLRYLTLAGKGEDGYEWIGSRELWDKVTREVEMFEMAESYKLIMDV